MLHKTLKELKKRGYKLAVISGSLNLIIDILLPKHPFDDIMINTIQFDKKGRITRWQHTPFDEEDKLSGLKQIARRERISLKQCVFVGDNENDVVIARASGFSIAFNPKSKELAKVSDVVVKEKDLRKILKYL